MTDTNHLHLPSLSVRGFRGIDALTIPRLGPVTLLAGKNGVGKTTVLDAVRVYAARGRYPTLSNLLQERDELLMTDDEEGDGRLIRDWEALFYGPGHPEDLYFDWAGKRRFTTHHRSNRVNQLECLLQTTKFIWRFLRGCSRAGA